MGNVKPPESPHRHRKPTFCGACRFLVIFILGIFIIESGIMLLFRYIPLNLTAFQEAGLDSLLLVFILFPLLYLFFFRPLTGEISQCRLLNEELENEEAKYRSLTDISPDCIKLFDRESRLLFINTGGLEEHGLTGLEAAKKYNFKNSIIEEDREKFTRAFTAALKGQISSIEIRHTREGSIREVCLETIVPVKDSGGKVTSIFGVSRDITKLKSLEKNKELLTQLIIHDLRNPLGIIINIIEYLKVDLKKITSDEQKEQLELAVFKCQEMKRMISNILDISKMEEDKLTLHYEDIALKDFLAQIVDSMNIIAKGENKKVSYRISCGVNIIRADREILGRVIINLLANAIKYGVDNSEIEIKVICAGKEITMEVKNEGKGIPEEYRERIFDKFAQIEDDKLRQKSGKGLGLTFCKMAVEAHGGRIWVESEANKATVFYLTLPVKG